MKAFPKMAAMLQVWVVLQKAFPGSVIFASAVAPKMTLKTVPAVPTSMLPVAETESNPELVELVFKSHSKIEPFA